MIDAKKLLEGLPIQIVDCDNFTVEGQKYTRSLINGWMKADLQPAETKLGWRVLLALMDERREISDDQKRMAIREAMETIDAPEDKYASPSGVNETEKSSYRAHLDGTNDPEAPPRCGKPQENPFTGPRFAEQFIEELERATRMFPDFNSAHEGYAVIEEEMIELRDEVFAGKHRNTEAMRKEAIQVAAMAMRFVRDCIQAEKFRDELNRIAGRKSK